MPVVIEVVDSEAKLAELMPWLEEMVGEGVITLERIAYRRFLRSE